MDSPDKTETNNSKKKIVLFNTVNCKTSPFTYDLTHQWNQEKHTTILLLPLCSDDDSTFITQCINQPIELMFCPLLNGIVKKKIY